MAVYICWMFVVLVGLVNCFSELIHTVSFWCVPKCRTVVARGVVGVRCVCGYVFSVTVCALYGVYVCVSFCLYVNMGV